MDFTRKNVLLNILVLLLGLLCTVQTQDIACSGSSPETIGQDSYNTFFSSPNFPENYPNDARCHWNITTPHGAANVTRVRLDFAVFWTEWNADFVYIYDGADMGAGLIKQWSGDENPGVIKSSGPALYVYFSSNPTVINMGFFAMTNSDPGCRIEDGVIITLNDSDPFYVETPYYNISNYPTSENCTWIFHSDRGYANFVIDFESFYLEDSGCLFDYLEIHANGNDTRYCGQNSPGMLFITEYEIKLIFVSDYTINRQGFRFAIWVTSAASTSPAATTITSTTPAATTISTTLVPPKPMLPPLISLALNGSSSTQNGESLSPECEGLYNEQLIGTAQMMASKLNLLILDGILCDPDSGFDVTWKETSFVVDPGVSNKASLNFLFSMLPVRSLPIGHTGSCAAAVLNYSQSINNWPIMQQEPGCPVINITSPVLDSPGVQWCRPPDTVFKAPKVIIPLKGTVHVAGGASLSENCALVYSEDFSTTSQTLTTVVNVLLSEGELCPAGTDLGVIWKNASIAATQTGVTSLDVRLEMPGESHLTLEEMNICATAVLYHVTNLYNWPEPVIPEITPCPALTINPYFLSDGGMAWCTPEQ